MHPSSSEKTGIQPRRILYFDYLRVLAIYTTVAIHIISQVWYSTEVTGLNWNVYNVFLSSFCWGVPVFTMISGALFLNPERTVEISTLYSKNIARLVTGFCFWAVVYALIFDIRGKSIQKFLYSIFTGDFHMWFILMIIVMYMLTPLLRRFTDDIPLTGYFLKLSFLISFLIPQVVAILDLLEIPYFDNMVQGISKSVQDMAGYFPHYCLFYFIAGHYLTKRELTPKERRVIYLLGFAGYLFTVVSTGLYSNYLGVESQIFHDRSGANIACMSLAVFVFGKYALSRLTLSEKALGIVRKISACGLGIYYVHLLIIKVIYGLLDLSLKPINPFITCMVFPAIAFTLSYIATAIMRKIPFLKKFV